MRFRRVFGLFLDARSAAMIRGYIGRRTQGDCLIYCFSVVSPRVSYLNLNQTFSSWQNDKNYMIAAMRSNRFREILERENNDGLAGGSYSGVSRRVFGSFERDRGSRGSEELEGHLGIIWASFCVIFWLFLVKFEVKIVKKLIKM